MSIPITILQPLVSDVLTALGYNTASLVNLLLGTCAQESQMGTYEVQLGGGPALGIFQMEPNTFNDITTNFLSYHKDLSARIATYTDGNITTPQSVVNNHWLACAMAACSYIRHHVPVTTDDPNDVALLFGYYKKYYNGPGAATLLQWQSNYVRYVSNQY